MTIKPVTSLADLEFKAKADKHYEQLAILGCKSLDWNSRIKTYPAAIKKLHQVAVNHDPNSCQAVIYHVNSGCNKIKPIKDSVAELIKKKEVTRIIDNLKKIKKANVTKKTVKKIRRRVARSV